MFVSASALFPALLPDDMGLTKLFEEATAYASVNVNTLEPHKLYPIITANRIPTEYVLSVVLTLRIAETNIVQVFLPKHYIHVVSDAYMDAINSKVVSLHLVYKWVCESSKIYFLAIASYIYTFSTNTEPTRGGCRIEKDWWCELCKRPPTDWPNSVYKLCTLSFNPLISCLFNYYLKINSIGV